MNNHKKTKHPESYQALEKRGRGRPRKYFPNQTSEFETNNYESFFINHTHRAKIENETMDINNICESVFDSIYKGNHKDGLYELKDKLEDVFLLNKLIHSDDKETDKTKITCDSAFLQYLNDFKDKTNANYFQLMLKFTILFRECFNKSKNKDDKVDKQEQKEDTKGDSSNLSPENLPEMCNEFYSTFMDANDFFGMTDDEKKEIIDLIQHFCIWLYKKEYTKCKLSLIR